MIVWVLVARLSDTCGQLKTLGMSTTPSGPSMILKTGGPWSVSVSVSVPPDQRRSGWRSLNSDRAPPPASRPARYAMSASSTGRIRSQCGAMSRSWHSPSSAAISASDSRGCAASSLALSGHGCPSHTRCRLAWTAAAGVARSRASSAPNSGILASGAGTRNSG